MVSACHKKPPGSPRKCAMEKLFKWKKVSSVPSDPWLGTILSSNNFDIKAHNTSTFPRSEKGHWCLPNSKKLNLESLTDWGSDWTQYQAPVSPTLIRPALPTLSPPPPFGILGKLLQMCACSHTLQSHTLHVGPPLLINTDSAQPSQLCGIFNVTEI